MKRSQNRQWRLKSPIAITQLVGPEHFEFTEDTIPEAGAEEILLRTLYLGTSPAQRSYVSISSSMHDKVQAGDVMRGRGIARVENSNSANFKVGDIVIAPTGWQDYSVHSANASGVAAVSKILNPVQPYSLHMGILGAAGYTAYFGLTAVANSKPGDTVLVTAAAGGVGSCAVQIARAIGCKVVGIAGGPAKCHWLTKHLQADVVIDYKNQNLDQALAEACPDGIDVFFDNVGGEQLDTALKHIALGARITICGYISTDYTDADYGPANYIYLLRQRARMQGLFVFDYQDRFHEADSDLQNWYQQGLLVDNCDTLKGLENMPLALQSLFTGGNTGVRLCQVAPEKRTSG